MFLYVIPTIHKMNASDQMIYLRKKTQDYKIAIVFSLRFCHKIIKKDKYFMIKSRWSLADEKPLTERQHNQWNCRKYR